MDFPALQLRPKIALENKVKCKKGETPTNSSPSSNLGDTWAVVMEKAMAPHSSTLAWKIPWMEGPGRLQFMGSLESDMTSLHFHFSLSCIGEGNGNPLQCSCLENPRDGGAYWAAVYGVAQSRTRLKQCSSSSSNSRLASKLSHAGFLLGSCLCFHCHLFGI